MHVTPLRTRSLSQAVVLSVLLFPDVHPSYVFCRRRRKRRPPQVSAMAVAACRSNLARLISTHAAPPLLAYTRFAAAGPSSYAQRHRVSPLDALVFARATHASAASAAAQAPIASSSKVKSEEILCDRPPAVIPESPNATPSSGSSNAGPTLSSDAASPQVAARPPDPPRAERAKPQLRSRKAALSLVRVLTHFPKITKLMEVFS